MLFSHAKYVRPFNNVDCLGVEANVDRPAENVRNLNGSASYVFELLKQTVAAEAGVGNQAAPLNEVRKLYFLRNGRVSRVAGTDLPLIEISMGASR